MKTTETKYAVINKNNGLFYAGARPFTEKIDEAVFFDSKEIAKSYLAYNTEEVVELEIVTEYKVKFL